MLPVLSMGWQTIPSTYWLRSKAPLGKDPLKPNGLNGGNRAEQEDRGYCLEGDSELQHREDLPGQIPVDSLSWRDGFRSLRRSKQSSQSSQGRILDKGASCRERKREGETGVEDCPPPVFSCLMISTCVSGNHLRLRKEPLEKIREAITGVPTGLVIISVPTSQTS